MRDLVHGVPGTWSHAVCPARGCGFVWLDPMPLAGELPGFYRDYGTHAPRGQAGDSLARRLYAAVQRSYLDARYGAGPAPRRGRLLGSLLRLHPGRRADADHLAMYVRAVRGGRLLDVGCGEGRLLDSLRSLGWDVRGLDFDPAAVSAARSRGLEVDVGTIEERGYPAGSFDAVTSSHVLEHVLDPRSFVAECRRILRPGGLLVVVTPNARSLGHRRFGDAWRGLEPPRHLHLFTRPSLDRLARGAGFADAAVRTTVRNARGIHLASRALRAAAASGAGRAVELRPDLAAELWQFRQAILRVLLPDLGEELVLVARR